VDEEQVSALVSLEIRSVSGEESQVWLFCSRWLPLVNSRTSERFLSTGAVETLEGDRRIRLMIRAAADRLRAGAIPVGAGGEVHVFGYGSLVWKGMEGLEEPVWGKLLGWSRRLWQGSPDHRGTPLKPGRVATLVSESGGEVWGRMYSVSEGNRDQVLEALSHREQGGYVEEVLMVHVGSETVPALVYRATAENEWWLGDASPQDIARQVLEASGPSGTNREYVEKLYDVLVEHCVPIDAHLESIVCLMRQYS